MIALGIAVGCMIAARILQTIVLTSVRRATERTKTTLDDFLLNTIQRSAMPFLYIFSIYLGVRYLALPVKVDQILHGALMVVIVFFIIRIISDIISYSFQRFMGRDANSSSQVKQARGILLIVKIVMWMAGLLFLVDNFGYNITTIIAGLGIGGIAIALAAQAILADLFSYLVIFFDKPFEIGDFIIIGDKMGSVEYIGIKTTRLRAIGGEQLIISNTDLTNSRVQNFKRMEKRRVVLSIGVAYETTAEQLRSIPGYIKAIVQQQESVQFDRAHFSGFGDYSLNFEIVYYIPTADYNIYMDHQQAIDLAIFEKLGKEHIEFAYPTQRMLVDNAYDGKQVKNGAARVDHEHSPFANGK